MLEISKTAASPLLILAVMLSSLTVSAAEKSNQTSKKINSFASTIEFAMNNFPITSDSDLKDKFQISNPVKTAVGEYSQIKGQSSLFPSAALIEYRYRTELTREPFMEFVWSGSAETLKSLSKKLKLKFESKGLINPHDEGSGYYFQALKDSVLLSLKSSDKTGKTFSGFTLTSMKHVTR